MATIVDCECGTKVEYSISEGSNPGCKEREYVYCPKCHRLLDSGVYNDASVHVDTVPPQERPEDFDFNNM